MSGQINRGSTIVSPSWCSSPALNIALNPIGNVSWEDTFLVKLWRQVLFFESPTDIPSHPPVNYCTWSPEPLTSLSSHWWQSPYGRMFPLPGSSSSPFADSLGLWCPKARDARSRRRISCLWTDWFSITVNIELIYKLSGEYWARTFLRGLHRYLIYREAQVLLHNDVKVGTPPFC